MTDSGAIGFKAGLEVHQQLDTGKLFCRCESRLREDEPHYTVRRRLRAVVGESGELDRAALEAVQKNQSYVYHGYFDSTCLVELDEEPPRGIDPRALDTVVQIALLARSHIARAVPVMRKLVVDGSNTSAFQRTALVATGGHVAIAGKKIGLQTIVIEEDSARPMEKKENEIHYRLDRLGVPLIEIATEPDFISPDELQAGARAIGELLRRTCAVKRGLGTIRQDLNISIAGGARVEIKGVQELDRIAEFANNEIARQQGLLRIRDELAKRGINANDMATPAIELTTAFSKSDSRLLAGARVYGIRIPRARGLLGNPIQPDRRFGSELSDYAKRRANVKGIIHSDEDLAKYPIRPDEEERVRTLLCVADDDAFVLCASPLQSAERALAAVTDRLALALQGIPSETRNALENGSSEYLRTIASAARMYPETDEPIIRISDAHIEGLRPFLPKTVEERETLYAKWGLSKQLADKMKLDNYAIFFENLCDEGVNPTTAAVLLLETLATLERQNVPAPSREQLRDLLLLERDKRIDKKAFAEIIASAHRTRNSIAQTATQFQLQNTDEQAVREQIRHIIEKNNALIHAKGKGALGGLMGDAMKQLGKTTPGNTISRIVNEELEQALARK